MRGLRIARLAGGVLLVGAVAFALVYRDRFDAAALEAWVGSAGAAGPLLFMVLYAAATVLFLPGSVVTLAGGALFGPVAGTFYNLTGATIGAALAFLVARYLAADWVEKRVGGRTKRLMSGVQREGWRFVAFVRLVPLFPFNLLNFALGLTRIRFVPYVVTTYVAMLPGAVAYTYLGYAGREAVAGGEGLIQKGLLALALLAVAAFLPRLIKRLRVPGEVVEVASLRSRLQSEEPPLLLDVRDDEEFQTVHIDGARHLPLAQLQQRLDELANWRERPLAVICKTDRRSAQAVRLLDAAGFAQPILVKGGMVGWEQAGFPVEGSTRAAAQPSMD